MTQGAMQPGVPLVSMQFQSLNSLEMPRSVKWRQPEEERIRFQGLMSLWIILWEWRYSKVKRRQQMKNLVQIYVNRLLFPMWQRRSPPSRQSIKRYRFYRSWKAKLMLIRKGCLTLAKSILSFMTEFIDFFIMILALYISFIAQTTLVFLCTTFQTLPKPPFPIAYTISKSALEMLEGALVVEAGLLQIYLDGRGNFSFSQQMNDQGQKSCGFSFREVSGLGVLWVSFNGKLCLSYDMLYIDRPDAMESESFFSQYVTPLLTPLLWVDFYLLCLVIYLLCKNLLQTSVLRMALRLSSLRQLS